MTSVAKVGDEDPEVYRFYSISEVRETIGKLRSLRLALRHQTSNRLCKIIFEL